MTFWHVLKTFFPHPSKGWGNHWEVGNDDWGLLQFLRRAQEINPSCLTERAHDLLVRLLDPEETVQPWQECRDLTVFHTSWTPEDVTPHIPKVSPQKAKKRSILLQGLKNRHRKPSIRKKRR